MSSVSYDPTRDIPDLAGKVFLVTGGTNGLGRETVLSLVEHGPAKIIFTGRQKDAAESLIAQCKSTHPNVLVSFISCDLTSLAAVKDAARSVLAENERLDVLLAVAGIMSVPPALTKDGYEIQFGTNHLGHALLIQSLLPLLEKTASRPESSDVRIVIYTSTAAQPPLPPPEGVIFDQLRTKQDMFFGGMRRYGQSKLANLIYARKLAEHYPRLTIVSVHPGVAWTGLVTNLSILDLLLVVSTTFRRRRSPQEVAWNGCWAATAPLRGDGGSDNKLPEVESGVYYEPVGVRGKLEGPTGDDALAQKLWEWTQKELEGWMADT